MPVGGVQDVQCAQLLPRVAQEAHAARTYQGGVKGLTTVYVHVCTSTCTVGTNFSIVFSYYGYSTV